MKKYVLLHHKEIVSIYDTKEQAEHAITFEQQIHPNYNYRIEAHKYNVTHNDCYLTNKPIRKVG